MDGINMFMAAVTAVPPEATPQGRPGLRARLVCWPHRVFELQKVRPATTFVI